MDTKAFVLREARSLAIFGVLPEMENPVEPLVPDQAARLPWRMPRWAIISEAAAFLAFSIFFLVYGVTPFLGGDGLGLVGADEPRYAQIAHEMLVRFDAAPTLKDRLSACVTPYLYGHQWLEKPALYYWRAMFIFQDFGVHDWAARLSRIQHLLPRLWRDALPGW